jgi:viologen exporter family transport system ATP-binding protein
MDAAVELEGLGKTYRVREPGPGVSGALRALWSPRTREVVAVRDLHLRVGRGERVAFVGPNGAGKSTTIKMLSGILHPSAGRARVLGLEPWRERHRLAFRIGTVFGQRTQLWYHLPPRDTFELLRHVYERDAADHRVRLARYVEQFGVGRLLDQPVRQLSLGERMRCEVVASLLHDPEILFLDEPTIGLDVDAKAAIRDLVRDESERLGRTLLFTSHDTGDMEQVCERVVVIHLGRLLLDERMDVLRSGYIRRKRVSVHSAEERIELPWAQLPGVRVTGRSAHRTVLEVDVSQTPVERLVQELVRCARLQDLSVEDPPMEEIVRAIYRRAEAEAAP